METILDYLRAWTPYVKDAWADIAVQTAAGQFGPYRICEDGWHLTIREDALVFERERVVGKTNRSMAILPIAHILAITETT